MRKLVYIVLLFLALLPLGVGCSGSGKSLVVGSKDFAEQFILAQMYALLLEQEGFDIELKLGLAGTPVAQTAITNGEIDLYPEYTGTGLLVVLKLPVESSPQVVYEKVSVGYLEQFDLVWLDPASMNNSQALAVPQRIVDAYGISTISDMVANASELRMVGPVEFPEREDGLPGLKRVYGDFELASYKGVEKGLRYEAIQNNEADVTVAFGTDGELAQYGMLVLADDKGLFPPYQVAPVIRGEVLETYPEVAEALNVLAPLLTNPVMQQLNLEVSVNQREPVDVAREFLQSQGLLTE